MTDQNTPDLAAASTQEGAGAAAAPPRRRRVSRPAAAPEAAVQTTAVETQAVETPAVEPAAEAAAEASSSTRTRRASSKSTSAKSKASTLAAAAEPGLAESGAAEPAAVESGAVESGAVESAQVSEAPARATRRKRATRATGSATAADDANADAPASQDTAAQVDVAGSSMPAADEAAPEKPARRRRAAVRPVAAPEIELPAASDAPVAATPAGDAPVADAPVAEEAPAEKKPARRRSRRASAPADEPAPAVDTTVEDQATDEPAEDEAARDAAIRDETIQDETTQDETIRVETTQGEAAVVEAAAPAAKERVAPRLATTALLFQAPDPAQARPRRRRVTSSAGSPEEISQAARQALLDAERAQDEASAAPEATDEPRQDETAEQTEERPSRRRGRRGRGGAARSGEAPVGDEPKDDEVEPVLDGGAPADESPESAEADELVDDQDDDQQDEADGQPAQRRRRRRGGRGRRRPDASERDEDGEAPATDESEEPSEAADEQDAEDDQEDGGSSRRRRRRRRGSRAGETSSEPAESRRRGSDEVTALRGSTRLEAKRQRRREGRDAGRRRQIITESEFLARRESVERSMIVRELHNRMQIAVLEDGVLVEHYVSNQQQASMVGNVYLGRVQNVLPSMEAAFVDVGKGRNAVLYAGEVNWDAAGLEGQPRRIEQALKSGDSVLVQVTKDPIGHKGARLTSQVTLAGRYLVYVPGGGMTGISRKLPDTERNRLKKILREVVPDSAGVIVRTAAEGASEDELRADIARLQSQWEAIEAKSKTASAPALLQGEPDMAIRVVRDIFNDDFSSLVVQGDEAWSTISSYIDELAPDLARKVSKYTGTGDVFAAHRIDEQLVKGMDRKVWLPSGGSLVIDRTEAMTVVDVNTGKFTGSGGTLEETVTRNNLEAAEEIVRQLRLRDIGGIIVIDFIDMVLESNRDLVLRRLVECLGRDRTKHQVAEVTSLGLVQMTRKRVGQGLVEAFSETCEHCHGRGFIVHSDPVEKNARPDSGAPQQPAPSADEPKRSRRKRGAKEPAPAAHAPVPVLPQERAAVTATLATIAAAAAHAHELHDQHPADEQPGDVRPQDGPVVEHGTPEPDAGATDVQAADDEHTVAEPAGAQPVDTGAAGAGHTQPTLDVLAELATLRGTGAQEEHLELTPVDPSVFVTFDSDESEQDAED